MPLHLATKLVAPLALAVAALGGGAVGWVAHDRTAGEASARQYLIDHPEAVPTVLDDVRAHATAAALVPVRGRMENPFPGAVLGNPRGRITLVEFLDYACGYCRRAVPDVEALIAANPDLKVVVREWPILTPESADAAKIALAAAAQGKFAAFHAAMFRAGRPAPETITAAAQAAGVDLARARKDAVSPAIRAEIASNHALAQQIGAQGTPTWEIDGQAIVGAVERETLAAAIVAARRHATPEGTLAMK